MSRLLNVDASTPAFGRCYTRCILDKDRQLHKPAPEFSRTIAAITLDSGCFDFRKLPTFEETLDRFLSTRLSYAPRVFRHDICRQIKCRSL
jgi:hypothetical protein